MADSKEHASTPSGHPSDGIGNHSSPPYVEQPSPSNVDPSQPNGAYFAQNQAPPNGPYPPLTQQPAPAMPPQATQTPAQAGEEYKAVLFAQCAQGNHQPETKYGPCGIITAIVCFPCGLICLFTDTEKKCSQCGIKLS